MFPNYLPTAAKTVGKRVFPVSFAKASDEDILSGYYMNAKGEEMKIEKELSKNMTEIDSILCIKENFDIVSRLFTICGKRACVYYIIANSAAFRHAKVNKRSVMFLCKT